MVLVSLLVFIASHAFGQGAVIWVFISEIFPNRVRAPGQALGSFTHWVMAAAISWTFPVIATASGGHAFAFYALMMTLQLLWVLFVIARDQGSATRRDSEAAGDRMKTQQLEVAEPKRGALGFAPAGPGNWAPRLT